MWSCVFQSAQFVHFGLGQLWTLTLVAFHQFGVPDSFRLFEALAADQIEGAVIPLEPVGDVGAAVVGAAFVGALAPNSGCVLVCPAGHVRTSVSSMVKR